MHRMNADMLWDYPEDPEAEQADGMADGWM